MGIEIGLESNAKQVQQILKAAAKMGASIGGVELRGKKRKDGPLTNDVVEEYIREQGLDFTTPNQVLLDKIGLKMAVTFDKVITKMVKRMKPTKMSQVLHLQQKRANAAVSMALRDGMRLWMEFASKNLDSQTAATGSLKALNKAYTEWRFNKYGVPKDVKGKATGQLLENLADKGAIRLTKR